jgi:hypothetical protein
MQKLRAWTTYIRDHKDSELFFRIVLEQQPNDTVKISTYDRMGKDSTNADVRKYFEEAVTRLVGYRESQHQWAIDALQEHIKSLPK